MKSFTKSYLWSLASATAGAMVGVALVAVPYVLSAFPQNADRIHFFLKWAVPFVAGFAVLYGLIDAVVRKKYLAIRRWTRGVFQGLL